MRRKPRRAVAAVVDMLPLVDMVMPLLVVVDARPCVEDLGELEVGVPEHRHRLPRARELRLRMEKLNKIRSKTSLSWTNLHRHRPTWWT
jgi:hypothetical protein